MEKERMMMAGMTASDAEKRLESYRNLTNLLAENGNILNWNDYMCATKTMKVVQNLKVDLTSQKEEEVHEAAGICIHLLACPSFLTHIDTYGQKSLFDTLIKILKTSKDRKIINIVLQCLAKSRLKKEAYLSDLQKSFDILREILQLKDLSPPVVCEALQVVLALFNASSDTSFEFGKSWFPSTFSKMFHANLKVRKSALDVISKVRVTIDEMSNPTVRKDLITTVLTDLKDKYCKDMVRILVIGNFDILEVWRETVNLLGTELHSSRYLINCLLNVVEKAFKIADPDVRVESFNTWCTIIDNFALDEKVLTNQKKLQLLLAPFKMSNVRTEDGCNTKLCVWWHLVCLLADKGHLVANFEQAVVPLLRFCFIGGLPSQRNKGGLSNRNLIMSGALSSPRQAFSKLHVTHAEVLAQILATDSDVSKCTDSLPDIGKCVMSSALFMRYYPLLLKCFGEAVQALSFSDEEQNSLVTYIFSSLLVHIRTVTAPDVQKKEVVAVVRELFSTLSHIENLCHPGDSQSQFLFKFFSLLTMGDLALPKKILNSHQYHIPTSGSGDAQDIMCGTLSNHLITQLCRPALLHHSLSGNEFISVWTTVLENSQPVTGKLRFLQAAIQELSTSAIPFLCPGHPYVLCHLWNTVLEQMLAHIDQVAKTSECDDSEPDWSCIYSVLHFPVIHATEAFTCAPFDIFQQIMETWRELWNKFTIITSATPTMEPNSEVEHVASTLLTLCQEKTSDVPDIHAAFYIMTVEVLVQLTETFQYTKLGQAAEELSPSPAKTKKKPHPLHNLGSTMELTIEVFDRICSMVSSQRMHVTEKLCQAALSMMKGIQVAPMRYIQEFITHIVKMLSKCVRVNPAVVFVFKVEKKCIGMLRCFTGLVKVYITQMAAKEFELEHLNALEPLFSAAFTSTNKKVKQEVQKLLEDSIASITAACLDVPSFLLEVQTKWGTSTPESARVNDSESMEDFIEATPKEKRKAKSLSVLTRFKASTPRSNTPLSSRKLKTEQSEKNEQDKRVVAISTPSTRFSVRVRKVELKSGKSQAGVTSPTPLSTPSTPEASSSRVALSTTSSDSTVTRVIRTCRNAPSPQNREGKHTMSLSISSESEGKEYNKTGGNMNIAATNHSSDTTEPIVISSTESEKMVKDCDKASHVNGTSTDVEVVSNAQRKPQKLKPEDNQQNSSLNHSEESDDKGSDCSEVSWKSEQLSIRPPSRTQDKANRRGEAKTQKVSKEKFEKANKDLCIVLHDTSLEVQKLLDKRCLDEKTEESTHCMKMKPEEASSPHKKSQTATNKASEETSQNQSVTKRKRINFMEVNVSPSVIKDAKLAEQKPEVKITNDEIKVDTPQTTVLTSDSEDEIFGFPEVSKPMLGNSISVPEKRNSDKKQLKEILPHKPLAEEQMEGTAPESSSSGGKRKRRLFSEQEEIVETSIKRRKTENTTQSHNSSFDDSIIELGSSNSEEVLAKKSKETPKPLRKTRSHPGQTDTEKEERSKTKSAFSPKITRSGRKIVPPNKDMPEAMTPPKKSKKKLHQKFESSKAEGSDRSSSNLVNLSNSASSSDEISESLPTEAESGFEGEMEVDIPLVDKVSVPENKPKKSKQIGNETKETEFDFDASITIIGSFDASPSREKSSSSKSKMKETENLEISSSKTQKDGIEEVDKNSSITGKDDCSVEDRGNSHVLFNETNLDENESNSSEIAKSKSDEPAPKEEEEQQSQRKSDTEKGMDLSEDLLDSQKTSEDSTPMECGQDLDGEVSYPAARRGSKALDDSVSAEIENQHEDVGVVSHANKEGAEMELMCVEDDKVKRTEDKDKSVSQEESNEDSEEDDKSSCGEDDLGEEVERTDTPTSPDPEEEEEEEEEYLSAGQEKEEQGEEKEKTKVADVEKMQQEAPCDGVRESEKNVPVNLQEQENLEGTDSASDKKKSNSEFNSIKMAKLSLSEKNTIVVIYESELQEMDTSTNKSQEDQRKDCTSGKEMEVMNETNVSISEDVMVDEDASEAPVKMQEKLHKMDFKKSEQHTVLGKTQNELQEDNLRISRNVQESKETEDAPHTTKDSDETDKDKAESSVCENTISKEEKEESQQIGSSRKQLVSEKVKILEAVTSEKESLDTFRKETEANLTPENIIGEVVETVSSPSKNVEVKKALASPKETLDTNVTVFSPKRSSEVKETVPVSGKDVQVNQTVSSPSKTFNINEIVSSPRKTVEVKVPLPRKNVQVKEMATSLIMFDHDKETAPSPRKAVPATETATSTPERTDVKSCETSSDMSNSKVEEDEAEPKAPHHTERTADTAPEATSATSESSEASEELAVSTRQQEEELSPDKSSRSRLKQTVSTPERMKQRGAIMHAGSRAALLVACAKQNIKNRGGGEGESPSSILTEGGRSRSLGLSPIRRSAPGRPSPGHSPDGRRKSLLDSVGMRPWVKHTPSPGASPSTSILKRTLLSDGPDGETPSPPPTKYRRVSFADPPVSDRVEIPPSPRTLKGIRAQKRLDMTRMTSEVKDSDVHPDEKQVSREADPEVLDQNNPLCPALLTCQDKVEQVTQHLNSPLMLPGLLSSLEHMGITTVGQLCKLTEWDINSLPIKAPKVTNTRRVLKEYEKMWRRENSPVMDEVEVSLAKMFGELDDKENLRPNHQDSAASEVTKAEAEVRESTGSVGRSSHSDNIQEIMDMEDITPLYSSPEETEEGTLKNLYRRASEDDLDSQKKLLHHLLQTLPSTDVAEAISQCIKARMADVTAST